MSDTAAIQVRQEPDGSPSLSEFFIENGRLPFVTDEVKPWEYRGWLVPYIQMCEAHPSISPRYDYVLRTIEAGRLLDEPIPECRFVGERSKETDPGMKMLAQLVKTIESRTGYSRSIDELAKWLGFATGVTPERSELADGDQEQLYRIFDISKWLTAPSDYLGEYMAEYGYGKGAGFFPTPMPICTMMAQLVYGDGDHRLAMVNDPCVGTGRTLLAASNYSLRLTGQDINWLCVLVTKINFAIFAPWHLIPASFFPAREVASLPAREKRAPAVTERPESTRFTTEIEQPKLFEF